MTEPPFRIDTGGSTVPCGPDQKMLDAFLRGGVWIPNSCNQGTCGTCKVRISSGTVETSPAPDTVLSTAEQDRGYVLACQSIPTSDVTIDSVGIDSGTPHHVLRDIAGTVGAIRQVADDTLAVTILLDEPLEFTAGQYVELSIPDTDTTRPYSMANPPSQDDKLEFHIRRQPGGCATDGWIFDGLAVGDPVSMTGPWGDFCYTADDPELGLVLLAGGTGLAPLKSIAAAALELDPHREIHVYHGVRFESDLYDVDYWHDLAADHPGVRYTPCLSRGGWTGRTGYVGDALVADLPSCKNFSAYLCGPPAMVEAGVKALKRRRISPRRIHRESYTPTNQLTAV
ncbi:oxidoreductase [Rhodococcus sp. ACPA4]|uniref:2Fe-2S iron-sulfur cluster-binding protein n=1 Tax=Rhodococcus sp. ACPA4 TaxID=2028571 RepID=UPI000BB15DDA|nr:2Fe-2S iron-sulfur cluster-binding protein [Rhodococcus sp. ACPA4]PBC35882.1 oxidoreductase [Rhodococcus sp. ACPA4]